MQTIKTGSKVIWYSQSAGIKKKKVGRVIAVLKKNVDYTAGQEIPMRLFVDILREHGFTRDEARGLYKTRSTYLGLSEILEKKYKLRFKLLEGMQRDENHYLIEVEDGERKPFLYHPRAGESFAVIE
jgi:hypothetical protein